MTSSVIVTPTQHMNNVLDIHTPQQCKKLKQFNLKKRQDVSADPNQTVHPCRRQSTPSQDTETRSWSDTSRPSILEIFIDYVYKTLALPSRTFNHFHVLQSTSKSSNHTGLPLYTDLRHAFHPLSLIDASVLASLDPCAATPFISW